MPESISSPLFDLIHCMSMTEKKHFKLYARYRSNNQNETNYLRLFDIIAKQKEYNEQKIVQSRALGIKKEHLRGLKHYLRNLILESLRMLRSKGDSTDSKIKNMLENAYIMREKGMVEEEMKFLKMTKEIAMKHERWGVLLETLLIESEKISTSADVKARQGIEGEIDQLLIKLRNLLEYMKLASKTFMHVNKSEIHRNVEDKTLKKLIAHPLLSVLNGERALSLEAKKTHYNTIFLYRSFIGDYQEAYKIISKMVRFVESNYSMLSLPELTYSTVLNNLTIVQHNSGKYQEALSTIHKHRSFIYKSAPAQMSSFIYSYVNETNYYITTGKFKKGTAIIKDIEKGLDKFKFKISDIVKLVLYTNIALLYFGDDHYHKSLVWVNKIINHPKVIFRQDVQACARILQILIHYELNTPDIIEYLNVSTYRFLFKRERLYQVEKSFLHFIRRLSKIPASPHTRQYAREGRDTLQKERLKEFRRFRDELVKITKDPKEKKALLYINLISWLESKIQNRTFAEVVREKNECPAKKKK